MPPKVALLYKSYLPYCSQTGSVVYSGSLSKELASIRLNARVLGKFRFVLVLVETAVMLHPTADVSFPARYGGDCSGLYVVRTVALRQFSEACSPEV